MLTAASQKVSAKLSKRHKYRAKPAMIDGHRFPSQAEARRYCWLKTLQRQGQITNLELQPVFRFACGAKYIADFRYQALNGQTIIEDVKGVRTSIYRLKLRMLRHEFPGAVINEVK